jgi:hypothetical protein|tara:strand:+ start:987 stop:1130 length:144 start_codon:yes stop_codon:yes gene_type:complete
MCTEVLGVLVLRPIVERKAFLEVALPEGTVVTVGVWWWWPTLSSQRS